MDRLSPLFARFAPAVEVFHSGSLCTLVDFGEAETGGQIHVLRSGGLAISDSHGGLTTTHEPCMVLYPRPSPHRLAPDQTSGADLVCARVDLGAAAGSPLVMLLPPRLVIALADVPELAPTLELLFAEGFTQRCGRQAALNGLMQYLLVLLLRHLMNAGAASNGLMAGLAEPRLARALTAMHERPESPWSLETLAQVAEMSRARFAHHFRMKVGMTPLEYLGHWRMSIARTLLRRGKAMKAVAPQVGYTSAAAFTRAFARETGQSPTDWLRHPAGNLLAANITAAGPGAIP